MAVNRGDSDDVITKYVQENNFTFTVLKGDKDSYAVHNAYGVRAYPTNYVLDADGKVAFRMVGFNEQMIRQAVEKLGVK